MRSLFHTVPWPSGKARVCKTLIPQFKSGRYLHKSASFNRSLPIFYFSVGKTALLQHFGNALSQLICQAGVSATGQVHVINLVELTAQSTGIQETNSQ